MDLAPPEAVWSSQLMMMWLGMLPALLATPESVWIEAETLGPLKGANFSFMREDRQTSGSWSLAGPDTAASWTQGGESEFGSIAARADEPAGTKVGRDIYVPAEGAFRLWVRYADYRGKEEPFIVRITQGARSVELPFGATPIIDELDPMKLLWEWAYGWDSADCTLKQGPARLELVTASPSGARRNVDCLCLTTDLSYAPTGRAKPNFSAWSALAEMKKAGMPDVEPLVVLAPSKLPAISPPPVFLWNVGPQWSDELKRPAAERVGAPFAVDPPMLKDFLAAHKGTSPEVYGHALSGPAWHIPDYPAAFSDGSPFLAWLEANPDKRFAILLNYGEPAWPPGADKRAVYANLQRHSKQYLGAVAGENIAYANVNEAGLEAAVRSAKSRGDVLLALQRFHTEATVAKFSDYFGTPLKPGEAWANVISCLSANNEALCHALAAWGVRFIGHESTANSPSLARRLAFLRGAARQFGSEIVDYQSANFGDSATIFSRESYSYPATSRYIFDNSYDAWAGAGTNWLLKDYLLWYLAGASAFYHEQGQDIFWKPGGGAAGDDFPVQLSPKGKVTQAVQRIVAAHPRPTQFTPVAFLLDEAHGWSQERFQPGSFSLDPVLNPAVLSPGRHEASLRGWFDVAYYPSPETQSEPATAIRQTYVNGIFGDIFDVVVDAPGRTSALSRYSALIAAGELSLTKEWSDALVKYVEGGGTLVASSGQFTGVPAPILEWNGSAAATEASGYVWMDHAPGPSATYRHLRLPPGGRVLASTPSGSPLVTLKKVGKGQVVAIGVPLGLGLDERPVPFLGQLIQHVVQGLVPIRARGDAEWTLGQLPDGGWLVGIFNNRGVTKPQHGIVPTDHAETATVRLSAIWPIARVEEWVTGAKPEWKANECTVAVPAGAVRLVAVYPLGK